MPGDAVEPLSATRKGWATWPSFTFSASAKRRTASSIAFSVQSLRPSSAAASRPSRALLSGVIWARALSSAIGGAPSRA
jgi:hypothetical protein